MNVDLNNLPDDVHELHEIISSITNTYEKEIASLESEKNQFEERSSHYESENLYLKEQVRLLKAYIYGKKNEKLTPEETEQGFLFNEAEEGIDETASDDSSDVSLTTVKSYTRKKTGRKPLSDDLPREEIVHDLSDEEKKCPCCGKERPSIGSDESEELEFIPAKIVVLKHIRKKYGPCSCDAFLAAEKPEVLTAPAPPRMIPGSIASPGLLAEVLTSKFADSLPFYRQEKIFKRIGVELSRQTMCNWEILVAEKCEPLIGLLTEEMRSGPLIHMDETTVQVLQEPGRKAESKSYMWVAVGKNQKGRPLVLYQYHPTRSGTVAADFLEGYTGFLQTDGYAGYNQACKNKNVIHVGCFAHARRYFFDAHKVNKKSKTAKRGLDYIQKLYKVEHELRSQSLDPVDFIEKRKVFVQPILDEFYNWLLSQKDAVVPKSKAGQAVEYTLAEWEKLIRYLDSHLLTPDNNTVENAIRPFVVGRKNWLFSNTPRGAHASAVIYSLVESAKANKLEPYDYLRYLFTLLPGVTGKDDLRKLLPGAISAGEIDKKLRNKTV
jgi:transposase